MRRLPTIFAVLLLTLWGSVGRSARAQRHSLGAAPPTAPTLVVPKPAVAASPVAHVAAPVNHLAAPGPAGPIAPVSSGLGAIQLAFSGNTVPAPQTLVRQLSADDERARIGALSSLGVPGEYLVHGRVPVPHSVALDLVQLGHSDDLDALLTIELDQHVVSAVLVPNGDGWRRVATLSFASSFSAGATSPATVSRPLRSWLDPGRYRASFHATVNGNEGDFTENEADLRVINGRAAVVISFVSGARQCDITGQLRPPHQTCELIQRWVEPEANDPAHHLTLITGVGHISAHEADDPLSRSRAYRITRLRSFSCQLFAFSDSAERFEPVANSAPCAGREPGGGGPGGGHPGGDHAGFDHGPGDHGGPDHP